MAFAVEVWWKDRFGKPDAYKKLIGDGQEKNLWGKLAGGDEGAWKVLAYAEQAIANCKTPEERAGCIEFVHKAADLYFQGRHKQDAPQKYVDRVAKLEERTLRLDAAYEAERRLTDYGPPRQALQKFKDEAEARREKAKGMSKTRQVLGMSQGQTKAQPAPAEMKNVSNSLGLGF